MTQNTGDSPSPPARARTLRDDTLIAFLSNTHIGGDPGHDIFESPEELTALLEELSAHGGSIELVLAGDFFDFLEMEQEIRGLLTMDQLPPINRNLPGREIDVFVSGHTHAPSLSTIRRENGDAAIIVNSGCWLRQLQPIQAHFRGPPVFVSKFVLTYVRVFLGDCGVRVELWEHPKPARVRLRAAERIVILGRLPAHPPGTPSRVCEPLENCKERGRGARLGRRCVVAAPLCFYREWITDVSDELTSIVIHRKAPTLPVVPPELHGKPVVVACCYACPLEDEDKVVRPLKEFGSPLLDLCQPKPFLTHQAMFDPSFPHGWWYYSRSCDVAKLTDDVIEIVAEHALQISSPLTVFPIFHLGGMIARVGEDRIAFNGRSARHTYNITGATEGSEGFDEERQWVRNFWSALEPYRTGAYVNFLMDEGEERVRQAYGAKNYDRLKALKRRYDRRTSSPQPDHKAGSVR